MPRRSPDLLLEQLRLGELPERLRKRLLADPQTAERLMLLEKSDEEILRRYPPGEIAGRIRERSRTGTHTAPPSDEPAPEDLSAVAHLRRVAARSRLLPLLAALLVVGLSVPIVLSTVDGRQERSEVRVKGLLPSLRVYRESPSGIELLHDGSRVRRGDLLQIGYVAGEARYGMIFSIDGRGAITLHLPERANGAPQLQGAGQILLPFSYELDSAPRFERFVFVTSTAPFSVAQVLQAERLAVAKQGPNALPSLSSAFSVVTVTLDKGEP